MFGATLVGFALRLIHAVATAVRFTYFFSATNTSTAHGTELWYENLSDTSFAPHELDINSGVGSSSPQDS